MLLGFGYVYKFLMFYFIYIYFFFFKKQKIIDKKLQLAKILKYHFFVFA